MRGVASYCGVGLTPGEVAERVGLCRRFGVGLSRRFGVRRVDLFGSVARGSFVPGRSDYDVSEYDVLVEFERSGAERQWAGSLARHFGLLPRLEDLLAGGVEQVERAAARKPRFPAVAEEPVELVYAA